MSKKCAVCKQGKGPEICEVCGFTDGGEINKELLDGDAEHWLETVVKPYRVQWKARERESELLAQLEEAKKREAELVSQISASSPDRKRKKFLLGCILTCVLHGIAIGIVGRKNFYDCPEWLEILGNCGFFVMPITFIFWVCLSKECLKKWQKVLWCVLYCGVFVLMYWPKWLKMLAICGFFVIPVILIFWVRLPKEYLKKWQKVLWCVLYCGIFVLAVLPFNPGSAVWKAQYYNGEGIEFADKKKDYDRAITKYSESIKHKPFTWNYINRGLAYLYKGDRDRAITDYTEAIRLNPQTARAYYLRGNANLYYKGDRERAITDYTEAIRLSPKYAEAYYNRGNAYRYYKGDRDRALTDYTEAIRLNPKYAEAYYYRGTLYSQKADTVRANADFAKARELGYKTNE